MNPVWKIMALAVLLIAGGCNRGAKTTILKDPGPAQFAEAQRLGEEAQKAQKAGDKARAIALYQESLKNSQELWWVWHNLGMLTLEQKDRMQAVVMFQTAADLNDRDPRPYYNIGVVYADNAQPDRGMEYFRKSLERNPTYLPSLRGVARVGRQLSAADDEMLRWMREAMLIEKDPVWHKIFEEEKYRIDGALQASGRTGRF